MPLMGSLVIGHDQDKNLELQDISIEASKTEKQREQRMKKEKR